MTGRTRFFAVVFAGLAGIAVAVIAKTRCQRDAELASGVRIVYSIDLDAAIDDRATDIARDLELKLDELGLPAEVSRPPAPAGAITVFSDRADGVAAAIRTDYGDSLESRTCESAAIGRGICYAVSASLADAIKKTALDSALGTIRRRIDGADVDEPSVIRRGDQIIVELPGLDDARAADVANLIARAGKLEFKVVDDGSASGVGGRGSEFMQRLFRHVGSMSRTEALAAGAKEGDPIDPLARELGVYADHDYWPVEDQPDRPHSDYYLKIHDRRGVALPLAEARRVGCTGTPDAAGNVRCDLAGWQIGDRYLARLAELDPTFEIPADHQIAYERFEPSMGTDRRPYWRSYYLWRAARLTGSAIARVEGAFDPNSNAPIILLELSRAGARVFGDLTAEIVGQKLATMLDGRVMSAPIINGPIRGGRASITMGSGDPDRQTKERDDLIRVLEAGSLPAPLREESRSRFGPP